MPEKKDDNKKNKLSGKFLKIEGLADNWWQPAVAMFARLSAWVAAPAVIAAFLGDWLDEKYNSAPWGLVGVVGIAFTISMTGLVIEASKEFRRLDGSQKSSDADQLNKINKK